MFAHLVAALAKLFFAAGLIGGASGAGNIDLPEWHLPKTPIHTDKTEQPRTTAKHEEGKKPDATTKTEDSKKPEDANKPEPAAKPETGKTPERYSFEKLLKECVRRYTGHLEGAKDVCTAAIKVSGLDADAFWAKYRSLFAAEPKKAEAPRTSAPVTSFEALLKECVARYARGASNTKDACNAALRASGLDADAFWAKYRSLMIPPKTTTTETPKPIATPKPTSTSQLSAECMAKYEAAKAAKNGPADVFEALVRSFNETCRSTTEGKA